MNYDEYMEAQEMEYRKRIEAREKIKGMSKNVVAAKMVTSGRGPGLKPKIAAASAAAPIPTYNRQYFLNYLFPKAAPAPVLSEPREHIETC